MIQPLKDQYDWNDFRTYPEVGRPVRVIRRDLGFLLETLTVYRGACFDGFGTDCVLLAWRYQDEPKEQPSCEITQTC